jgi:hypothetical protein
VCVWAWLLIVCSCVSLGASFGNKIDSFSLTGLVPRVGRGLSTNSSHT